MTATLRYRNPHVSIALSIQSKGHGVTPISSEEQAADFFISYTAADRAWAEWIAWQLHNAGYTVRLQAWDFMPGRDFLHEMEKAMSSARKTIAVLSDHYTTSAFGEAEWRAAFAKDPTGEKGLLIPVKVMPCTSPSMLASRVYIDLVGKAANEAKDVLLTGVSGKGLRPLSEPAFPGQLSGPPMFPGDTGPKHAPLQVESGKWASFPAGRTAIYLPGGSGIGAAVASDRYDTLRELLDDLYVSYLNSRFAPFSYGEEWVLVGQNRCIVPLVWLSAIGTSVYKITYSWQGIKPSDAGLCINQGFRVYDNPGQGQYFGIITDDERILDVFEREIKAQAILGRPDQVISPEKAVGIAPYEAVFTCETRFFDGSALAGKIFDLRGDRGAEFIRNF